MEEKIEKITPVENSKGSTKDLYLLKIFKSNYCKIVFIVSLVVAYLLIPSRIFYGIFTILGLIYMIVFALTLTCTIRNVKERIMLVKKYQTSIVAILAAALGIIALQVCSIGAPVCGAVIGAGILSLLLPSIFISFLNKYALIIVIASIIIQVVALYFLNCFKNCINC